MFQIEAKKLTKAIVFVRFTANAVQVNLVNKQSYLLRKPGKIDAAPVTIVLNCEASTNVIHPGLASRVIRTQRGHLKRFAGSLISPAELATDEAIVHTSEGGFLNMTFTESNLDADQDVIFDLPCFREYAPQFDWNSGQFVVPTQATPSGNRKYQRW